MRNKMGGHLYPIFPIESEIKNEWEILDVFPSKIGGYEVAIHDHSASWGDAEIFSVWWITRDEIRFMFE